MIQLLRQFFDVARGPQAGLGGGLATPQHGQVADHKHAPAQKVCTVAPVSETKVWQYITLMSAFLNRLPRNRASFLQGHRDWTSCLEGGARGRVKRTYTGHVTANTWRGPTNSAGGPGFGDDPALGAPVAEFIELIARGSRLLAEGGEPRRKRRGQADLERLQSRQNSVVHRAAQRTMRSTGEDKSRGQKKETRARNERGR